MGEKRVRVGIVGLGGLGLNLARKLSRSTEARLVWVVSNSKPIGWENLAAQKPDYFCTGSPIPLPTVDWVLLAVPDPSIAPTARWFAEHQSHIAETALFTHTAGNEELNALEPLPTQQHSVIWPVQSFVRHKEPEWQTIPWLYEATDPLRLCQYTHLLGTNVFEARLETRQQLHIAAVFASNFSNWMLAGAQSLLPAGFTYPTHLAPLVAETLSRLANSPALANQTGPARRGDTHRVTLQHQWLTTHHPEWATLYDTITRHILSHYHGPNDSSA